MIEIDNVSFSYDDNEILNQVSFKIKKGSFVGIVGENGSGKTTLLKLILGLEKPFRGSITVSKEDIVAYVRQTSTGEEGNFPASVEEAVTLGTLQGKAVFLPKESHALVAKAMKETGLDGYQKRIFGELSGGFKQRVKIAMALVQNPSILILDEPMSGLDEKARLGLLGLIDSLRKRDIGILMVTHRRDDLRNADEIYRLSDGELKKELHDAPI